MPADCCDHDHDHKHGHDCGHDHSHDHDHGHGESVSVQIANQMIDLANAMMEHGVTPEEIAAGLRHGAANFSAYGFFRSEQGPKDPNAVVDEFVRFFEYYLGVHQPKQQQTAAGGFESLIAQAKKDF